MSDLKIFTNNIEDKAMEEIETLLNQEAFKDCKVRIMPDVHAGMGCVIGFTGNLGKKVIPNIVGVDIGCGMLCCELGNIDINLAGLDNFIKTNIPNGFDIHNYESKRTDDNLTFYEQYIEDNYLKKLYCYDKLRNKDHLRGSLGTLGGGNHFIEIDVDDQGNKYLVIHTGSRNLGKQVADIYQEMAVEHCSYKEELNNERLSILKEYKEQGREREIGDALKALYDKYNGLTKLPKDLCYLEGEDREDYLHDMRICQQFAHENRCSIAGKIIDRFIYYKGKQTKYYNLDVTDSIPNSDDVANLTYFESVHNYIDDEDMVRKGAISAHKGKNVIIPMNMRDGCIIGIGKGNEDWNYSAPHGAGRIMSRMKAREVLKVEDFQNEMSNIYTTTANESTLDEAPMAYKPMEEIVNAIGDTVEITKIIKPIYNFKAAE